MDIIEIGSFQITNDGIDYVRIEGKYNQVARITAGDMESLLSALCDAYKNGKDDGAKHEWDNGAI